MEFESCYRPVGPKEAGAGDTTWRKNAPHGNDGERRTADRKPGDPRLLWRGATVGHPRGRSAASHRAITRSAIEIAVESNVALWDHSANCDPWKISRTAETGTARSP